MLRAGLVTSVQAAAALLLMLTGWGFHDLAGFLVEPARAGLFALVVLGAAAALVLHVETQPLRKGLTPSGRQGTQLGILLALSLLLLWSLPHADRRGLLTFHSSLLRNAGLSLCAIGGAVRLFALRRLGRQFSAYVTLQPQHRLVQQGIYGRIRHPLYLSLLLAPAGIALVFANWLALPIFALSLTFVADRIRQEEQLLATQFGAEFLAYRRRTSSLIPRVF